MSGFRLGSRTIKYGLQECESQKLLSHLTMPCFSYLGVPCGLISWYTAPRREQNFRGGKVTLEKVPFQLSLIL